MADTIQGTFKADTVKGTFKASLTFDFQMACFSPAGESIKAHEAFVVDATKAFVWVKPK